MSNIATSTSSNIFYQARCKASTHNEQLRSRESAADYMMIDRGRLYRIESGLTNPYPEEVVLMADLYNAPELRNYYCTTACPLGKDLPKVDVQDLDRITIRVLHTFRKVNETNSFEYGGKELTVAQACAFLAGVTAGADYVTSLTYTTVPNATRVIGEMNNEASVAAIEAGQTFFSVDESGNVILEYDINSHVTTRGDEPEDIRKNRPLRVYDTFANDLLITFVPGKFDNDEDGWGVMEGLGRSMLQNYLDDGAITNVDLDADFLVDTGRSIGDSTYFKIGMQAVDSAEKYYFDVNAR